MRSLGSLTASVEVWLGFVPAGPVVACLPGERLVSDDPDSEEERRG